jgi:hypothetical protein
MFCFSLQRLLETFHIVRRIRRDITNVHHTSYQLFLLDFKDTSRQISKNARVKYYDNLSIGSRVVQCVRGTDRRA